VRFKFYSNEFYRIGKRPWEARYGSQLKTVAQCQCARPRPSPDAYPDECLADANDFLYLELRQDVSRSSTARRFAISSVVRGSREPLPLRTGLAPFFIESLFSSFLFCPLLKKPSRMFARRGVH
jgi:hypothetical protein